MRTSKQTPTEGVTITAEFRTKRHDQTAIMIWDGSMEENPVNPDFDKVRKYTWIDVNRIIDHDWEYLTDLAAGDQVVFLIPEWYATKKGLV
jgi:hypothetical protein